MKLRKRAVGAIALGVVVAALALAGCSSSSPAKSGSKTLDVAYWNYGPEALTNQNSYAKGFEAENPGVTVKGIAIAGTNWGEYYANLATLIASGKKPDNAVMSSEGVKFLDQNHLILPINDYLKSDPEGKSLLADIAPGLMKSLTVGKDITTLPDTWNDMVIYYNTDLFKQAGIAPPAADWTTDQFEAIAKQLTDKSKGQYGFAWTGTEVFPGVLPWIANQNANLVSGDVCKATANSAGVEKAFTFLDGLIQQGISPVPPSSSEVISDFQNGKIAMFGAGAWPIATFAPAGFTSYDIQLYPTGSTYKTVVGSGGYPILKSSANPDLAWKFQKYVTSAKVQDALIGTPTNPYGAIPTLRSTAKKSADAGIPPANYKLFYGSIDDHPSLTPFPGPAKYTEFESTVLRYTQLIFGGNETVEQGLDDMQQALSTIVSCK
ncbi:MAG TPA: sugar ABC transporter substrate-binding protein [Steroidobacteraceae bacterium]|jgi:multiple sugar transport system substrate-binding protein